MPGRPSSGLLFYSDQTYHSENTAIKRDVIKVKPTFQQVGPDVGQYVRHGSNLSGQVFSMLGVDLQIAQRRACFEVGIGIGGMNPGKLSLPSLLFLDPPMAGGAASSKIRWDKLFK